MSDLLQVGGLWKNTSANGDNYLQGKLGPNIRILIFKNKYKTADNQPDYQIYFAPVERRDEGGGQPGDGDPDFFTADEALHGPPAQRPAARPAPRGQGADRLLDAQNPPPQHYEDRGRRPTRHTRNTPEPQFDDDGDLSDPFAE